MAFAHHGFCPSSILISVLLALLVVEIPARGVEDVAFDLSEISAIVEPMVRQARQQSTATVTVLKTVRTSVYKIPFQNCIFISLYFDADLLMCLDDCQFRINYHHNGQENLRYFGFGHWWHGQSWWHWHIYHGASCSLQQEKASVLG